MAKYFKVLLIDDHPLFRSGVKTALESQSDLCVCCEAASLADGRSRILDGTPDVVVLDLSLPDGSGLDLLRWMQEEGLTQRVVVMSVHYSVEFVRAAFRYGAGGYLTKGAPAEELSMAIRVVADGGVYADREVARALHGPVETAPKDPLVLLTDREREVATVLSQGLTTMEVAEQLGVSPKTIEAHRASIFRKLDLRNAVQLTRIVALSETEHA